MKYLEPSFSVAMSPTKGVKKSLPSATRARKPKKGHEFVSLSGVCLECGLDRIGHDRRFSR